MFIIYILPTLQLQSQQLISDNDIEYLIQTYNILVLILYGLLKIDEKSSLSDGFYTI